MILIFLDVCVRVCVLFCVVFWYRVCLIDFVFLIIRLCCMFCSCCEYFSVCNFLVMEICMFELELMLKVLLCLRNLGLLKVLFLRLVLVIGYRFVIVLFWVSVVVFVLVMCVVWMRYYCVLIFVWLSNYFMGCVFSLVCILVILCVCLVIWMWMGLLGLVLRICVRLFGEVVCKEWGVMLRLEFFGKWFIWDV